MYLLIFLFAVLTQHLTSAALLSSAEGFQPSQFQTQAPNYGSSLGNRRQYDQGYQQNYQHQGFQQNQSAESIQSGYSGQLAQSGYTGQSVQSGYSDQALQTEYNGYGPEENKSGSGDAKILSYQHDADEHNNYQYAFETDNGIKVQEVGYNSEGGTKMQGAYSYTGDDGKVYTVTYTADENGFHPQGAHIPTPPPMPDDIAKSVELNLKAEANGIVDDGQYHHEQYLDQSENKLQISAPATQQYQQPIQYQQQIQSQEQTQIQQYVQSQHQHQNQQQIQSQLHRPIQVQQILKPQLQQQKQIVSTVQRPQHVTFSDQQLQQSQNYRSVQRPQRPNLAINTVPAGEVIESLGLLQNINQPTVQKPQNIGHSKSAQQALGNLKIRQQMKLQNQPSKMLQKLQQFKQQQKQIVRPSLQVHETSEQQVKYIPVDSKQQPHVEEQHRVEYIFPTIQNAVTHEAHKVEIVSSPQNAVTEERHKVQYQMPSMKYLAMLQQLQSQKGHRQVLYQIPTYSQLKPAQDYIGPAPVVENQYE